jgi:hypothetical protein
MVAYHEAGHATAHLVLGHPFIYVTAHATPNDKGNLGWVAYPPGALQPHPKPSNLEDAICALAGPVAEVRYTRQSLVNLLFDAGHNDLRHVVSELAKNQAAYYMALRFARRLVRKHWDIVVCLALALVACGRLDYATAVRLAEDIPPTLRHELCRLRLSLEPPKPGRTRLF